MEKPDKKAICKNTILLILYALFTLAAVLHHEIWADEAQVWMIAKNVSFFGLFKHLVNEGHPSFFYLIVMPFAKVFQGVGAIFFMQLICWLSSCAAVFLLLRYSPFSGFAKFSIITSAGFLYFFPVIARSYSILPLLVFLGAILYPRAKERPILYALVLAAAANTHVIMFGFCAILALFFFFENIYKKPRSRSLYTAAGIMVMGLLAVVLQLHGTTSSNVLIKYDFSNLLGNTVKVFSQFFINAYDSRFAETGTIVFPIFGICAIFLSTGLYISFFVMLFKNSKKLFSIAFFGIMFQFAVYIAGYNHWIFVTRIFCAHIILLFCFWQLLETDSASIGFGRTLEASKRRLINAAIGIFFILTMLNGVRYTLWDLKYGYSGAKETAEFIEKNIDKENSLIITDNPPYTVSLAYYLEGKYGVYYAITQKNIDYVVWDEKLYHMMNADTWQLYIQLLKQQDKSLSKKKFYAVIPFYNTEKVGIKDPKNFKLVFTSKPSVLRYEGYRIYEYSPDY